jgi:hypothetical protein
MEDEAKLGALQVDDADSRILAWLSHKPFILVCSTAQTLGLAPGTANRCFTMSWDIPPRPFRWAAEV